MMCEALGKLGDLLALPVLLRVLEIGDLQERRSAALAVGELDFSSEAQQQLEELLRAKSAWAEKDSLTKAALEHFNRLIESRVEERQEMERQLRHFRDRAAYRLGEVMKHDADGQVRNFAAISLGKIAGASSKDGLLWGLDSGYARSLQGFSALGLGLLGDRSVAPKVRGKLTETYGEEDLRGAFAICLGLLRDRESGPAMIKILTKKSYQPSLRGYTAIGLGLMGYREAAPELRKILVEDNDGDLLRPVALALGLLGDREATDDLRRTLVEGRDRLVRGSAAMSHGLLRDFSSMEPLLAILRGSAKAEVREMAVIALGYLAEKGELPALSFLARDHNYRLTSQKASELLRIL
jgi:HEAT repeat protein